MQTDESREYIRHPSDIPITIQPADQPSQLDLSLNNVSQGGLAFDSPTFLEKGTVVKVKIHIVKSTFKITGVVQWCQTKSDTQDEYEVGIEYTSQEDGFRVRMVEQICHIEQYRKEIEKREGRHMSGEAAALEWITKHAAEFPALKTDDVPDSGGAAL